MREQDPRVFIGVDLPGLRPYTCKLYMPGKDSEGESLALLSNLQDWANDNTGCRLPRCPLTGPDKIVGARVRGEPQPQTSTCT